MCLADIVDGLSPLSSLMPLWLTLKQLAPRLPVAARSQAFMGGSYRGLSCWGGPPRLAVLEDCCLTLLRQTRETCVAVAQVVDRSYSFSSGGDAAAKAATGTSSHPHLQKVDLRRASKRRFTTGRVTNSRTGTMSATDHNRSVLGFQTILRRAPEQGCTRRSLSSACGSHSVSGLQKAVCKLAGKIRGVTGGSGDFPARLSPQNLSGPPQLVWQRS